MIGNALPENDRVRVASVPANHPYVAAIIDPRVIDLRPDPPVVGAPVQQWWPPRLLDPAWVASRTESFDVLHVHFGMESHPVAHIVEALDAVRRSGTPVVYTVHDLENPQLVDQTMHLQALDAMVTRADALVTLTDAAADEVARRWGRVAQVVGHPRLHAPAPGPTGGAATIRLGLHLRDLRPNIDGVGAVATLVRTIAELRRQGIPVVAEVHLDDVVRDEGAAERITGLAAGRGGVELHRHPRLDDDELATALARLDALILPYAWGTHSGWVELAYDAALPVVGTDVGAMAAQHPKDYHVYTIGDPASLARAVARAGDASWSRPGAARAAEVAHRAVERDAQLIEVRDAHSRLYRALVSARKAA